MEDADEKIRRVRELHRPRWYDEHHQRAQVWLVCHGCDEGAHAEDRPPWPCSTAGIVYTAREIAIREPQIAECTQDHGRKGDGTPHHPQAVFLKPVGGQLVAARWMCDHVQPVLVEPVDPWE